jgi:hypothetical protein
LKDLNREPKAEELMKIDPLGYIEYRKKQQLEDKKSTHISQTTGQAASSFTSTRVELVTQNAMRSLTDDEIMKEYYHIVRSR